MGYSLSCCPDFSWDYGHQQSQVLECSSWLPMLTLRSHAAHHKAMYSYRYVYQNSYKGSKEVTQRMKQSHSKQSWKTATEAEESQKMLWQDADKPTEEPVDTEVLKYRTFEVSHKTRSRSTNGWVDGWVGGWCGWVDGWVGGWVERQQLKWIVSNSWDYWAEAPREQSRAIWLSITVCQWFHHHHSVSMVTPPSQCVHGDITIPVCPWSHHHHSMSMVPPPSQCVHGDTTITAYTWWHHHPSVSKVTLTVLGVPSFHISWVPGKGCCFLFIWLFLESSCFFSDMGFSHPHGHVFLITSVNP